MPVKKSAILLFILLMSSVGVLVFSAEKAPRSAVRPALKTCDPLKCSQDIKDVAPSNGFPSYLLF
ncbi:MAG TPA: hypothetical protein PKC39_01215 [Ferruginibacter sp.]|nr:hypothetical protein [Ferruginibacter sp.]HMP19552.1 hypothetical protein [Ferruginibacter sp.]